MVVEKVKNDWDYELCKKCFKPNKIGFNVSDEDWKNIAGTEFKDKVLCYDCFEELSFEKNIPFRILGIYPVARVDGCDLPYFEVSSQENNKENDELPTDYFKTCLKCSTRLKSKEYHYYCPKCDEWVFAFDNDILNIDKTDLRPSGKPFEEPKEAKQTRKETIKEEINKIRLEINYTDNGLQYEGSYYEADDKLEQRDVTFLISCFLREFIKEEEDHDNIEGKEEECNHDKTQYVFGSLLCKKCGHVLTKEDIVKLEIYCYYCEYYNENDKNPYCKFHRKKITNLRTCIEFKPDDGKKKGG